MGMAASSLRFAQLTARKNQVEFEGQQINQQRLTLSQKSSAIYNDMLTRQVPTAPDPSAFTKIVYKFNNGYGTSSILNLAKKASGAYNYNVTYKRPKTTRTLSRSSFANVGFARTIGVTQISPDQKNNAVYYARTANVNGVARNLSLVGSNTAASKLTDYRQKLETYKNMQTIESQISALVSKGKNDEVISPRDQQNIKSALGLEYNASGGTNEISRKLKSISQPDGYNEAYMSEPEGYKEAYMSEFHMPEGIALDTNMKSTLKDKDHWWYTRRREAYQLHAVLNDITPAEEFKSLTSDSINNILNKLVWYTDAMKTPMSHHLKKKLTGSYTGQTLNNTFSAEAISKAIPEGTPDEKNTAIKEYFKQNLNDLERKELSNLLAQYANKGNIIEPSKVEEAYIISDEQHEKYIGNLTYQNNKEAWDGYKNYRNNKEAWDNYKVANSLLIVSGGAQGEAATDITNAQMITMLQGLLSKVGGSYGTSAEYKTAQVDPAFTAYQAATATPGIVNIGENQALYEYEDDNGDKCYMYVNLTNIDDDVPNTYADSVSIYENVLNYLDGEYETEQQDANVIMSEDGQVSKITFADGSVVTPEVVTEMDSDAYDQAMVEYEYKKEVYDKEMNDANAKVKIIQAQDQKLEVRLKQLDTEQKALQTEIDAIKSVRDKAIESSFRTFS